MRLFAHSLLVSDVRVVWTWREEVSATLPGGVTSLAMHHLKHDSLGEEGHSLLRLLVVLHLPAHPLDDGHL